MLPGSRWLCPAPSASARALPAASGTQVPKHNPGAQPRVSKQSSTLIITLRLLLGSSFSHRDLTFN